MADLKLPPLYSLDDVLAAINKDCEVTTRRTLLDIVQELGFSRGRGRRLLFNYEQAIEIQKALACHRPTRSEKTKKTREILRKSVGKPWGKPARH